MKILLIGEYSNVHWTLAEGLRQLGHQVVVASDGDGWKNYQRNINLSRKKTTWGSILYLLNVIKQFRKFKNYDVVQIINPIFLDFRANKMMPFYNYLRKWNRKVFMAAYGMDYYWVKAASDCKTFKYSDFNIGDKLIDHGENAIFIKDWFMGEKKKLNISIANDCDGIVAGLYEYYKSYQSTFPKKLTYIPFPIDFGTITVKNNKDKDCSKVRFFIGIQKGRSEYKGTDIMLRALCRLEKKYSDECEIIKVESVPFSEYQNLMNNSDVLLDQLYGYSPGMNALLAMAKGLITVGGGENECFEILNEKKLRPIVNVEPNEESVYNGLEFLIKNKHLIPQISEQNVEFVRKHHNHVKVAQQYLDFWKNNGNN